MKMQSTLPIRGSGWFKENSICWAHNE